MVRHAEAASNAAAVISGDPGTDEGLTEAGKLQARHLSASLRDVPVDLCVTSKFPRAIETARVALADRDVRVLAWPGFNDPTAGEYEGVLVEDYLSWARQAPFNAAPPGGGESLADTLSRYCDAYDRLIDEGAAHTLLVAHGLPISVVLRAVQAPEDRSRRFPAVPHAEPQLLAIEDLAQAVGTVRERLIAR